MLRAFHLENFKAWRDTGHVTFAPLTVFFGSNSSGKSSINHFLMMLKQTVRSADLNSVFDVGDVNAAVRLGSFRDVVFRHDLDRGLSFETEWDLPTSLAVRDPRSGARYSGDRLIFEAAARQPKGRKTVQSDGFTYRLESDGRLAVDMSRDEKRTNRWRLTAENYDLVRNPGRAWELPKPAKFYGFPNEASLYFQNTLFLSDLELALEERLDSISYLGPLRSPPERLYTWSGAVPEDVGWRGDSAVPAILAAEDRAFNWKPR